MTTSRFAIVLAATATCSLIALTLQQSLGTPHPQANPGQQDDSVFISTILESGAVRGSNDLAIRSQFAEPMVITSAAEDMTQVKKGDVILQFDDSEQRKALAEATVTLANVRNALAAAQAELASLERQSESVQKLNELRKKMAISIVTNAKSESETVRSRRSLLTEQLDRQQKIGELYKETANGENAQKLSSLEQLEFQIGVMDSEKQAAEIRHEISAITDSAAETPVLEAAIQAEELNLQSLQQRDEINSRLLSAQHEIEAATLQQNDATGSVESAQKSVADCVVHAPRDGLLVHVSPTSVRGAEPVLLRRGLRISPGAEIFRMPDKDHFEVEGQLNSAKVGRVKVGQTVTVIIDAFPDVALAGKVVSIAAEPKPGAWPNTDLRLFDFVVRFDAESEAKAREQLKHGMTCDIRIDLRSK